MASDDRRLLEVLRSLSPPRSRSATDTAKEQSTFASGSPDTSRGSAPPRVEAPPERADEACQRAGDGTHRQAPREAGPPACAVPGAAARRLAPRDPHGIERKGITLSAAETGVFFFAAVLLAVGAFLAGWYGRSLAGRNRPRTNANEHRPADIRGPRGEGRRESPVAGLPSSERLPSLEVRTPSISPARIARGRYTILVARFPSGDSSGAAGHARVLREQGFETASLHPTTMGIELRVGSFASPGDPLARRWLSSIRGLREAYGAAEITRLP